MTDDSLAKRVQAALEQDTAVNLHRYPIHITTTDGLRLEGVVEDIVAKRRAGQIAREVAGTGAVIDRLRIAVSREPGDQELAQAVIRHLLEEPVFGDVAIAAADPEANASSRIDVTARDGVVRLDGIVSSLAHRRIAEVRAWWTPGTGDVDNRLHVQPPEEDNDHEIADVLRMVFQMDPALDAQEISVRVHERIVNLSGRVATEANRRIAVHDCWYVPGVHDVRADELYLP